ncbi:flavoprotein [Kitasatospora sp. NPDC093550]|uniref:flavoprotein n=1 Tax=Kitasatospora sp. NPDC093550 TaxID=3364089 RepID=UPI003824F7C3
MIDEPHPVPGEPQAGVPDLGLERLLVVVTGSAYAWSLPYWLDWLRLNHPGTEVRVVLTRSAERFVTRQVIAARTGGTVWSDSWPEDEATARHVEWARWAQAIVVYPATVHFLARLALGLADSPALLAAQSTRAPVVVAPALPPGALDGAAFRGHWATLAARPNVVLVPPVPGRSLTTGDEDAWVPPALPHALRLLVESRTGSAAAQVEDPASGEEFGTGLLRTSVRELPSGGRRWRRTPGPMAPTPFQPVDEELDRLLARVDLGDGGDGGDGGGGRGGGARLVPGTADGPSRRYDVRGEVSVAHLLLNGELGPELVGPLRDVGRLLRALHRLGPPAGRAVAPSRALARLGDWLTGRAASPRAACAQGGLRRELGEERWSRLLAWYRRTAADPDTTLAHGAAGLGSLVVDRASGGVDLLVGEDVCVLPWYVDLGWVVGELVELQWQLGGDKAQWQALTDALFDGYGRDLGPEWHRIAALRILLHVHDIAAYLDGFDRGFDHYAGFLRFLVDLDGKEAS